MEDAPELVELSFIGVTFLDSVSRYGARLTRLVNASP
jgi:hypothetical protein